MFANSLGMLEAIARLGEEATAGKIQKMNLHMTVGQVKRLLSSLSKEGYVSSYTVPYGKTGKYVWLITNRAQINVRTVSDACWDASTAEDVMTVGV